MNFTIFIFVQFLRLYSKHEKENQIYRDNKDAIVLQVGFANLYQELLRTAPSSGIGPSE